MPSAPAHVAPRPPPSLERDGAHDVGHSDRAVLHMPPEQARTSADDRALFRHERAPRRQAEVVPYFSKMGHKVRYARVRAPSRWSPSRDAPNRAIRCLSAAPPPPSSLHADLHLPAAPHR